MKGDRADKCFTCGSFYDIELHHIFKGKNRKVSDRNGFTVHLCAVCHRGRFGVHGKDGHNIDLYLMETCQRTYEETHTRAEFMALIGKNYLGGEE